MTKPETCKRCDIVDVASDGILCPFCKGAIENLFHKSVKLDWHLAQFDENYLRVPTTFSDGRKTLAIPLHQFVSV